MLLHVYIENINHENKLDKFPKLKENRTTFESQPKVKAYLENRPKTAWWGSNTNMCEKITPNANKT